MQQDELLLNNRQFFTEITRMLAEGETVTIKAKGNSMFPFITGGRDSVVLRSDGNVGTGDIVLAKVEGKGHVVHRVYRVDGDRFVLMGDGNLHERECCDREDVKGKVVMILRGGKAVGCSSPSMKAKSALWRRLLPVRRYLLFVCRLYAKSKIDK